MVSIKRWAISLLVLMLLTFGGAAAWLYFGQMPKKAPLRARPVFAERLCQPRDFGENPVRLKVVDEHNNRNSEHTMAVPKQ